MVFNKRSIIILHLSLYVQALRHLSARIMKMEFFLEKFMIVQRVENGAGQQLVQQYLDVVSM